MEIDIHSEPGLRHALHRLASDLGFTVFDVAMGCFVALLYRHAQQSTVTVGAWVPPGRNLATDRVTPIRAVTCSIDEESKLVDIITSTSQQFRAPLSHRDGLATFSAIFGIDDQNLGTADVTRDQRAELALTLRDLGAEFDLRLAFDGHSFSPERMHEFLAQYQLLVFQSAQSPQCDVLEYSLITDLGRTLLQMQA